MEESFNIPSSGIEPHCVLHNDPLLYFYPYVRLKDSVSYQADG